MISGICSKVLTAPLERLKIVQQTESIWSRNSVIALKSRGLFNIYNGSLALTRNKRISRVQLYVERDICEHMEDCY